jgi:hexosaminidase
MIRAFKTGKAWFDIRVLHLDLKGVPPTFERLLALLDVITAARYNAVLIEWEDMFPWSFNPQMQSPTAYTPDQVRQLMRACSDRGIEVIPLVQCLGHMEMPLSLPEYASMREVPGRSDVLYVLAKGAGELVEQMIDDVLCLCPDIKYFHLGGDEAWTFGTHPDTQAFIERHGKDTLYMQHIQPLIDHLSHLDIRPILWHDMMVMWPQQQLQSLAQQVDLMFWAYMGHPADVDENCSHHARHLDRFKQCGVRLWCAGAFKGADQCDGDLPDFSNRHINALAWATLHSTNTFVGAVATGWSRYNTCSVQTCPIDASLDTLVDVGLIFHDGPTAGQHINTWQAALQKTGQLSVFKQCQQTLARLCHARKHAWENVALLRQLQVTARQDSRRLNSPDLIKCFGYLQEHLDALSAAGQQMRRVFAGLIPGIWIDRYLDERALPLFEEMCALKRIQCEIDSLVSEMHVEMSFASASNI